MILVAVLSSGWVRADLGIKGNSLIISDCVWKPMSQCPNLYGSKVGRVPTSW